MKYWYKVRSPEGYECLELADGEYTARIRASSRPGYEDADSLQVWRYKPYVPEINCSNIRAGVDLARERGIL
jgi:hypothetical protein